jgi:hypothetical protein
MLLWVSHKPAALHDAVTLLHALVNDFHRATGRLLRVFRQTIQITRNAFCRQMVGTLPLADEALASEAVDKVVTNLVARDVQAKVVFQTFDKLPLLPQQQSLRFQLLRCQRRQDGECPAAATRRQATKQHIIQSIRQSPQGLVIGLDAILKIQ